MSTYIPTQHTDSHVNSLLFSVQRWLMCSCLNACCCNVQVLLYVNLEMTTPTITTMLSLNVQYVLMSHGNLSHHPCLMYSPQLLKVFVLVCHLFYLIECQRLWHICSQLYGTDTYLHGLDFFIFIFLVILPEQPVCNEQVWSRFVYDSYPVLMHFLIRFAGVFVTIWLHLSWIWQWVVCGLWL